MLHIPDILLPVEKTDSSRLGMHNHAAKGQQCSKGGSPFHANRLAAKSIRDSPRIKFFYYIKATSVAQEAPVPA
jgi:hypothetical protein